MSEKTGITASRFKGEMNTPGQLIPSGIQTTLLFDYELFDALDEFDYGLGLFTPRHAGYYYLSAACNLPSVAAAYAQQIAIEYVGGNLICQDSEYLNLSTPVVIACNSIAYLTPNDTVQVIVRQNSGFNLVILGGPGGTFFSGHRLS